MPERAAFWFENREPNQKIQVWVWGDDVPLATAVSNRIVLVLEKADGFESRKEVL